MTPENFQEKKIAVIGFGVEGLSSARYFSRKGASVTVFDRAEPGHFGQEVTEEMEGLGVKFTLGADYLNNIGDFDLIVRSPGVKRSEIEKALGDAKSTITSQTQYFLENCPCMVIGVTGTKGKGTTASLIAEMLKASGFDAHLGGNIGTPPLDFLDDLTPASRAILELSSFQLQDVTLSPQIAVLLMVTSEHLDYHADHAEYIEAKRNILRFQKPEDLAVINRDYPVSNESDILTDGQVFRVSRERPSTEEGCFVKEDAIWVSMRGAEWKIIDLAKIRLLGKHNLENVCASTMAATLAGAEKSKIKDVLSVFSGLEHRLEFVREISGVKYYDDSFSTTPETAIAAIEAFEEPQILILGGSGKKSDFTELGEVIGKKENIKAIIGIGAEWDRIKEVIQKQKLPVMVIEGAKDMHTVVEAAVKLAKPGDVVLLSPACASFGMFKDYKDRGRQFKSEVLALQG